MQWLLRRCTLLQRPNGNLGNSFQNRYNHAAWFKWRIL